MSHYALIINSTGDPGQRIGTVEKVIVADENHIATLQGWWVQTSYNTKGGMHATGGTPMRKNYAGIGDIYDEARDAFYSCQPYPSWALDEQTCQWKPPVPYPTSDKPHAWDEATKMWVATPEQ